MTNDFVWHKRARAALLLSDDSRLLTSSYKTQSQLQPIAVYHLRPIIIHNNININCNNNNSTTYTYFTCWRRTLKFFGTIMSFCQCHYSPRDYNHRRHRCRRYRHCLFIFVSCLILLYSSSQFPQSESLSFVAPPPVSPLLLRVRFGGGGARRKVFSTCLSSSSSSSSSFTRRMSCPTAPTTAATMTMTMTMTTSTPNTAAGTTTTIRNGGLFSTERPTTTTTTTQRGRVATTVLQVSSSSSFRTNQEKSTSKLQRLQFSSSSSSSSSLQMKNNNNNEDNENDDSLSSLPKLSSLPSYKELILFTTATMLIWLSEPLLSLVDTIFVGWTYKGINTITQMAALGPATLLYDSALYLSYFLPIATTNTLAPLLATMRRQQQQQQKGATTTTTIQDPSPNIYYQLRQSTSHILGVGLVLGVSVMALLYGLGPRFIHRIVHGAAVGSSSSSVAAVASASVTTNLLLEQSANSYLWIRAIAAPMSVIGFVAQSICFTCLDTRTPAIAVLAASIVNIVGDTLLCPTYGIRGAAIATTLATTVSCCILLSKVQQTTRYWKQQQQQQDDSTSTTVEQGVKDNQNTILGEGKEEKDTIETSTSISSNNNNNNLTKTAATTATTTTTTTTTKVPFASLPDRKSFWDLVKLSGPIFFVMMSQVTCYNIGTIRVPEFGIVTLAAHNIMMRIFFFYAYIGDAIGQAALCFYPQVSRTKRKPLLKRLFILSLWTGVLSSLGAMGMLERCSSYLTKDISIRAVLATNAKYISWAILFHPFAMLLEGTLFAQRYFKRLIRSYSLSVLLHLGIVLYSPWTATFHDVWRATFVYEAVRLLQFSLAELWWTRGEYINRLLLLRYSSK